MNKGKILVSNFTLLNDLEFNKSVIIIVKDDEEATIGFILNKKSKYIISELNESCKGLDLSIYEGGPVAMDSLHFIHKKCKFLNDSIKITDDLYWGMNFKLAVELLKKDEIIVFNKVDLITKEDLEIKRKNFTTKIKKDILILSNLNKKMVSNIKSKLIKYVS